MGQIFERVDAAEVLDGVEAFTVPMVDRWSSGDMLHTGPVRKGLSGLQHNRKTGALVRCSKRYVATDPGAIGRRLEEAGFKVTKIAFNRSGNSSLLEARYPVTGDELAYADYFAVALDHRGRFPIMLQPGALRVACLNQFRAPAVRIHHCSPDALEFVDCPARFAFDLRHLARGAGERIEALRGRGDGPALMTHLAGVSPQLWQRAQKRWVHYGVQDHLGSAWAALQAFTDTKSPRLVHLTALALGEGYDEVLAGKVPACWTN